MQRPNIPILQIPAFQNNNNNIQRMNSPRRRFSNNNLNNFGPRRLNFNLDVNANIYAGRPHMGNRNVRANAENAVMLNAIQNGDEMVEFHGESALEEPRYYKKSTFNSLPKSARGTKKNPYTRAEIRAANVEFYRARKVQGGRKRKTRKGKKSSKRTRKH